jgi:murein DD-endopeptidase MepM/ murein hydrolase activator NlpD
VSRQNELAEPSRAALGTAVPSAIGLVPRPRTAAPRARSAAGPLGSTWDTGAAAGWPLAEPVDWDRDWAAARPSAATADLDDEYFDVLELPHDTCADDTDAAGDVPARGVAHDDDGTDAEATPARRPRRLPATPRRRPALLLAAAVVGALIAIAGGGQGGQGGSAGDPTASGLDYGLGLEEPSFSGGVDAADARGEISQAEAQARLGEIAASRAARQPAFVLPTQGRLTTCFCTRWGTMHWGIDLAAPLGTPIVAATDGVVLRAGPASGYGNAIYIQDADGNVEIYGHMRYLFVHAGDVVSAGDTIAKVGSEGQSTGPHLHFEIHKGGMNGKPTDPQAWLSERGITIG